MQNTTYVTFRTDVFLVFVLPSVLGDAHERMKYALVLEWSGRTGTTNSSEYAVSGAEDYWLSWEASID